MKLNKLLFEKHLNEKWSTKVCPMCGCNAWTYDDILCTPLTLGPNNSINLGGKIMPLVPVTCTNCGNTIFINALVAKAYEEDREV